MQERPVNRDELLGRLPPVPARDLRQRIRALLGKVDRKVIVLDDDPTGTQTVHGIPVITRWSVDLLARELLDPAAACYVLTNSRSLAEEEAVARNRQIAENLRLAAGRSGRDFAVVSRSDSTLRGHFPAEVESLEAALGQSFDAWVVCPFFEEGGRLTIDDVHYVAEGQMLVPAAQTPFAADAAFGYRHSNLRRWIQQKSGGRISCDRVVSLSIEELRTRDLDDVTRKLTALGRGSVCVLNAAASADLATAVCALLAAEAAGRRYLYRTAASFVAQRAAVEPRPLLGPAEMHGAEGRGILVVVGSYVPKTSTQLACLLQARHPPAFELEVPRLLDPETRRQHVAEMAGRAGEQLASDDTVVVYTSRQPVRGDAHSSLAIGRSISRALVDVVRRIAQRPGVLVAKGGITASDLATDACGLQRATVLGQILPGIPVWRCGPESRFPGMPLVVFPGNVGAEDALVEVVERLSP